MNRIQTGLRIPEELYEKLREAAERSGVSVNSQILYLIDVGIRAINLGIQQQGRELSRNQTDTCE